MFSEVKYFDTIDEVRKFLGDFCYSVMFENAPDEVVARIAKFGLVIAKDGVPAIHYSEQLDVGEFSTAIMLNAKVRYILGGNVKHDVNFNEDGGDDVYQSYMKVEVCRAREMGIKDADFQEWILPELFCPRWD